MFSCASRFRISSDRRRPYAGNRRNPHIPTSKPTTNNAGSHRPITSAAIPGPGQ